MKIYSIIIILFFSSQAFGQSTHAGEYVSLFNGENLDGWTAAKEKPESFVVEDGVLACIGGKSHLYYTGKDGNASFENFELRLRVMTTANSNSGVYVLTKYQELGWPATGFEAQVNSTHKDPKKTGSLYGIVNVWSPSIGYRFPKVRVTDSGEIFLYADKAPSIDDVWFDYSITVENKTISIRINGELYTQWTQPPDWKGKRKIAPGTICLQAHDPNSTTYYKDIEIRLID